MEFFDRIIQNKHDFLCCSFLLDGKIIDLQSKHTFKEYERITNKHQGYSTSSSELQESRIKSISEYM